MLQLYILCVELLVLFLSGLFGCLFLIYTYQNTKYKKTHYYRITHRPYLKMRRSTGSYGEYLIYNNLRSLEKEGRFLFNVYLPKEDGTTTEIDVLLIHKSGLYVFESKNYSGWIFGTESQRTWTQTLPTGRRSIKNRFFNPIMQNEGHISQLKQCLSDYPQIIYHSIILFSDRCELKKITLNQGKAAVMNRRRVASFVKKTTANTNEVLNPNEIEAIDQTLFPYSQTSEAVKQIHIENIQAKHPKHSKRKSAGLKNKIEEQAAIETASTAECDPPASEAQALEQDQKESAIQKQIKEDKEEYQMIPNTNTALDEQTKEAEKVCPRCGKPMIQRLANAERAAANTSGAAAIFQSVATWKSSVLQGNLQMVLLTVYGALMGPISFVVRVIAIPSYKKKIRLVGLRSSRGGSIDEISRCMPNSKTPYNS